MARREYVPAKVEVGLVFDTWSCGPVKVVELLGGDYVMVEFSDGTKVKSTKGNVRSGSIKNYNQPHVYGHGFHGIGAHAAHGVKANEYWSKMLQRAYCPIYKEAHPTYEDVVVCKEWLNYQNFAEWCTKRKQYGNLGYNLDKDIIIRGNKEYSEDFCSLVPQRINKLLVTKTFLSKKLPLGIHTIKDRKGAVTGYTASCRDNNQELYFGYYSNPVDAFFAYKAGKEALIKRVADEYKPMLDDKVYDALLKYVVFDTNGIVQID